MSPSPIKPRVLLFASEYPQVSQSYVLREIEALEADYEISVISRSPACVPARRHVPFECTRDPARIVEIVRELRPHVLHAHYLTFADLLAYVAERTGVPYTIRAHSFDALAEGPPIRRSDHCLGILAFPFTRARIAARGVPDHAIHDAMPVVDFARFHDRSPNGTGVVNVGACQPKKDFESFVALARSMPRERFELYAIGYRFDALVRHNREHGSPVRVHAAVEHHEMPAVYKRHRWLVYTACRKLATVGWPIAVAEAQASGLGVCMPNLRPDLRDYMGGAGFLYDSIGELPSILSRPVPEEMRERGFEVARRSDVRTQISTLRSLWSRAA